MLRGWFIKDVRSQGELSSVDKGDAAFGCGRSHCLEKNSFDIYGVSARTRESTFRDFVQTSFMDGSL